MGRETRVRFGARVPVMGSVSHVPTEHLQGLTLTDNLFSAKVGSSTVGLRISKTVTTGFGTAS
jgi:hypothetical protein